MAPSPLERLNRLREQMRMKTIDAYVVPMSDAFQNEYLPACAKRLTWLSDFTGSAGLAVIGLEHAMLFVDGRYTLQASLEVDSKLYSILNSTKTKPESWMREQRFRAIGFDPALLTRQTVQQWEKALGSALAPVEENIIDAIWEDQPDPPLDPLLIHPESFTGESSQQKRRRMGRAVADAGADAAMLNLPESVLWLLNIRGTDLPYTPFALVQALLDPEGGAVLYVDPRKLNEEVMEHLGTEVSCRAPEALAGDLRALGKAGKRVLLDSSVTCAIHRLLEESGASIVSGNDPCLLAKACKNSVELEGIRAAHQRDGLALTRFLSWLDKETAKRPVMEMEAAEKLEAMRRELNLFQYPSFATISGAGAHGAIVHYRATRESDAPIQKDMLYLLDSGGQYLDGTTDVTRTVAVGTPTQEQKDAFTRVLKGHIALATAQFPEGTSGQQLDGLARQPLWQAGMDYDHGTGHGVGAYLSVHEGPQRISKAGSATALKPGMILSNEPGFYKEGAYGIRIENLVAVQPSESGFLSFETLTLAPIDRRLIALPLLSESERGWVNAYHARVFEMHAPHLDEKVKDWLRTATAPL